MASPPDDNGNILPVPGQLFRGSAPLPALFLDEGENAWRRFIEFFTASIRNRNTREAYLRAVLRFSKWCEGKKLRLGQLSPFIIAAYIEEVSAELARPSVKQHLAAIRMLMNYLVVGQVMPVNPAAAVRGPKYSIKRGKTPVLSADQARQLLDSIDVTTVAGLRDRALIAIMIFSFARVSAVLAMNVEDYYSDGRRRWIRLLEKGGKQHEVPAHHKAEDYLDEYLAATGIGADRRSPLFRSVDRHGQLSEERMNRRDVLAMVKRRARQAGLPDIICNHSFRATGITAYLNNGGSLEHAQRIAAHESPKTTKLYDRTSDEITLDEIERILI